MRVVTLFGLGFRAIKAQACDVKHGFRESEIVFCELKSLTLDQLGGGRNRRYIKVDDGNRRNISEAGS